MYANMSYYILKSAYRAFCIHVALHQVFGIHLVSKQSIWYSYSPNYIVLYIYLYRHTFSPNIHSVSKQDISYLFFIRTFYVYYSVPGHFVFTQSIITSFFIQKGNQLVHIHPYSFSLLYFWNQIVCRAFYIHSVHEQCLLYSFNL